MERILAQAPSFVHAIHDLRTQDCRKDDVHRCKDILRYQVPKRGPPDWQVDGGGDEMNDTFEFTMSESSFAAEIPVSCMQEMQCR